MRKLLTTIIFSVTALLLSHMPNVYATEGNIYKCIFSNNKVVYQDFECVNANSYEISRVKHNHVHTQPVVNLRALELSILDKIHHRMMLEKILLAMVEVKCPDS